MQHKIHHANNNVKCCAKINIPSDFVRIRISLSYNLVLDLEKYAKLLLLDNFKKHAIFTNSKVQN